MLDSIRAGIEDIFSPSFSVMRVGDSGPTDRLNPAHYRSVDGINQQSRDSLVTVGTFDTDNSSGYKIVIPGSDSQHSAKFVIAPSSDINGEPRLQVIREEDGHHMSGKAVLVVRGDPNLKQLKDHIKHPLSNQERYKGLSPHEIVIVTVPDAVTKVSGTGLESRAIYPLFKRLNNQLLVDIPHIAQGTRSFNATPVLHFPFMVAKAALHR